MVQEVTWPYTFLIGEAAHDHHHVHPALAHRPGGVDLPYYFFIRPLEACADSSGASSTRARSTNGKAPQREEAKDTLRVATR